MMLAFGIWSVLSLLFVALGISTRYAKKPRGFWANAKVSEVRDVKQYNRALARLWFVFAAVLELLGLPLLMAEQNNPVFLLILLGIPALVIGMMIAYTRIESRYRKQR